MAIEVIITDKATGMFGEGDTYEEADADLMSALNEYKKVLESHEKNLGEVLQGHLAHLRKHHP